MFTVASGSMAPKYNVGDVLVAKETEPSKIKVGDSITYLGTLGSFANKVVTHEVTSIERDEDGSYIYHTKGISNLMEDPPVHEAQVYGVIVWRPRLLSFIYKVISTQYGMFIFVIIPILYVIGSEMLSAMLEKEEERREKLKESKKKEEKVEEKEEVKEKKEVKTKTSTKKTTTKKKETTKEKEPAKKTTTKKSSAVKEKKENTNKTKK